MHSEPIQCEADRLQGRPRHALVPVLLRIAAIAGFAFAGWLAFSALSDSAYAAEQPPSAAQADGTGSATLGHFTSGPAWRTMSNDVREVGEQPMRYVRSRQHDLFTDKDRAVGHVRELADDAGVPRVRVPDLRTERPVLGGLVHRVTDPRPVPEPAAQEQSPRQDDAGAPQHAESRGEASAARPMAVQTAVQAAAPADQKAKDCQRCRGDHRAPAHGPAAPGQDVPQGGGSAGGHPLVPVADLPGRRTPAAPPAVAASSFARTALTDLAAPGGPSVVPD